MVSKVLCFAFLVCILVQFVPATAKPGDDGGKVDKDDQVGKGNTTPSPKPAGASFIKHVLITTKDSVATPFELMENAAKDVFGAGTQRVKTMWIIGTTPYRFGKGILTKIGTGTALKDSATETLAENEGSINEDFKKQMKARNSIQKFGIESVDSILNVAKLPLTLIKGVGKKN